MLTVDEGNWWTLDGQPGAGQLRMRQEGAVLPAAHPDRVVVTGWRVIGDQDPGEVWTVAQVLVWAVGQR